MLGGLPIGIEDVVAKGPLEKTWYSVVYTEASGQLKQLTNARWPWLYHKKRTMEEKGLLVSPIFQRTYWYERPADMEQTKALHQAYCAQLLDERYMHCVQTLCRGHSAAKQAAFLEQCERIRRQYGNQAYCAMLAYGRQWRLLTT